MSDGIIISSKGINGSTTYFGLRIKNSEPILTNLDLKKFSEGIIRIYPEQSKKILEFYENGFCGNFPPEINVSKLDSNPKAELIEAISENFKKSIKK